MELSDRLGMYIGSLRACKGLQLGRLAEGICSTGHLARIEYGEREADKLTTDALLQRQFSDMAELNISWMEGDRGESLRGRILETLRLTQPGYGKRPLPER